jgi:glucose/arabinose dehydrogenase
LAGRGDDEIHVLTYEGQYAVSTNGGKSWRVEQVPWPAGEKKDQMRNQGRARQHRVFAATFLCVLVLAIGLSPQPALAQPSLLLRPLVSGLASPTAITTAGDGSGRLFITLQGGTIKLFDGSKLQTFLDISPLVSNGAEQGLLSTAFHPQYGSNGFFYVNYTNTAGATVIARYRVSANPDVADPNSAVILLTIAQPFDNHNGGQLQFGPDGYLYIGMGDGGSAGDPGNRAQDLGQLLGKLLRIDVNSAAPYIPPTNPFVGTPGARGEIWARGLRNPWRFSFDRLTGDLFIADVGQSSREEVDFQPANSTGGQNYGWRRMEGTACFNPSSGCNDGSLTLPIIEYDHSQGCSITGGYRYRGTGSPSLFATYLFGDLCSGRIWGATEAGGGAWTITQLLDTSLVISTFGEDESGELLVAHYDAVNGAIYRIVEQTASEIIIDNAPAGVQDPAGGRTFTGSWCTSSASNQFGVDSLYNCLGAVAATYRWSPSIPTAGAWDVYVWWSTQPFQSTSVPITVVSADGSVSRTFNEQTGGGQWVLHGRYNFSAGTAGYVQVSNTATGHVAADAVRFVRVP